MRSQAALGEFVPPERYRLVGRLGRGGVGIVFHAYDRVRQEEVALKTLHSLSPGRLLLLKQEFRSIADVVHPNLVSLFELEATGETNFFTMELVRGLNFLEYLWGTSSVTESETLPHAMPRGPATQGPASQGGRAGVSIPTLCDATAQLCRGLIALHGAGKVHRDVKPSNIMVTGRDRVVILDFGLTTDVETDRAQKTLTGGTPGYMAPEAATGEQMGQASDWYSVGVVLHEALTGMLPVAENGAPVRATHYRRPVPPSRLVSGIPPWLDDLCLGLLAQDPAQRLTGDDILRDLRGGEAPEPVILPALRSQAPARETEIRALAEAMARAESGRSVVAVVKGTSGMGKTTLVRTFLRRALRTGAVALEGRCYERESVPYKGVDDMVDGLSFLLERSETERPADFDLLPEMFPVLRRVSRPLPGERSDLEPEEKRFRAARALRMVLDGLGTAGRPVVIFIDDVHWINADGAQLLADIVGAAATRPLYLVVTRRTDEVPTCDLQAMLEARAECDLVEIDCGPLVESDARRFCDALLAPLGDGDPKLAEDIVREAHGNPLLIHTLIRHTLAVTTSSERPARVVPAGGGYSIGDILAERVTSQPTEARRVLEFVALAGRPLRQDLALQAAGPVDDQNEIVVGLRAERLLLRREIGETRVLDTYHDAVRRAVLSQLSPERTKTLHAHLASTIESLSPEEHEVIFDHLVAANDSVRARPHGLLAAERAASALAFDQAAALYRRLLALGNSPQEAVALHTGLADSLAKAGHAFEAAQSYLDAAEAVKVAQSDPGEGRRLRRKAAEQYFKGGHTVSGWRQLRGVLQELRIPIPRSHVSALAYSSWRRLLFLLRNLVRPVNVKTDRQPRSSERLDTLWVASTSLAMINPVLSDAFRGRHLLEALRSGDSSVILKALAYEASMESHLPGALLESSCDRLLDQVRTLEAESNQPFDRAWLSLGRLIHDFTHGRWASAIEHGLAAERTFRERCPGSFWERATVLVFLETAMALEGRLSTLKELQDDVLRDAEHRGDIFLSVSSRAGEPVLTSLASGRVRETLRQLEAALANTDTKATRWPENSFAAVDYHVMVVRVHAALYDGNAWEAVEAVEAAAEGLRATFLDRLRFVASHVIHLRARAFVGAADAQRRGGQAAPPAFARWSVDRLLADARRGAARMEKHDFPAARGWAALVRAGAASVEGDQAEVGRALDEAVTALTEAKVRVYAACARVVRGRREAANTSQWSDAAEATEWLRSEGVVDPVALSNCLVPGFALKRAAETGPPS